MQIKLKKEQVPWVMAAGRAMLGPVLIAGEACGWSGLMTAWLVVTALVSDIFDGVLARRWHCDTAGARLFDSMADTVFYLCAAIALWIGVPQVWRENAVLLGVLLGLEAVRFGLDFAKFGKPASYHSYFAKVWGLVMAVAVVTVFGSGRNSALIPVALGLGIACDLEGLAMSVMLPVWRNDVKTLRAAWQLRGQLVGSIGRAPRVVSQRAVAMGCAITVAMCLLGAVPAFAIEPGQVAYVGGTAAVASNTIGTLDTMSPTTLIFEYKGPNGTPGQIDIKYESIRSFEYRNDVRHHLGVLPAIAVGLLAARQRTYTFSISYADSSEAVQVAIFDVAKRDQPAILQVLRARDPHICRPRAYVCGGMLGMR